MTSAKPSCSSVSVSDRPYIVGIGASAGGVEALRSLLSRFTLDNTAFVVVLHISPYYDSKLAEILGRYAAMPVVRVEGLTVLAGNRIRHPSGMGSPGRRGSAEAGGAES